MNRLQVLPLIVNSDQTACIKGRTVNDSTRLLNDAISHDNEKNTNLAFISVDQIKAFDRVSHDFFISLPGTLWFRTKLHQLDQINISQSLKLCQDKWMAHRLY